MDEARLRRHLRETERQLAEGMRHIAKQRAIISQRERDGHDVNRSKTLLDTLLQIESLHERHRDLILQQLRFV